MSKKKYELSVEFDDEFTDSYIVGDRDAVFTKLLEKCREIDD